MLPTKGFFKDIDCPYHDRTCGRPYCHFRHRKKTQDAEDASTSSKSASTVPTYKPTPKSELANNRSRGSHIPISYVPDVVGTTARKSYNVKDRPTYKPTPKSVLSGAKQTNVSAPSYSTYTPTPLDQLDHLKDAHGNEINLEEEIQLIDEILTETIENNGDLLEGNEERQKTCDILKTTQEKANQIIAALTATNSSESSKSDRKKSSRDRDKHKSRDKDKEKDRDRDKRKNSSSSKSSSSKDKTSSNSKSSRSKSSHKSSSSSKSKSRDKDRDKDKDKKSSSNHHKSEKSEKSSKSDYESPKLDDIELGLDDVTFDDDDDDIDDMIIEDECLKIFNDYRAPETLPPPETPKYASEKPPPEEGEYPIGKKRVAYNNAVKEDLPARPAVKTLPSAGITLQNRIRIARQAHAANEAQNIMAEVRNIKRSAPTLTSKIHEIKKQKPNGATKTREKPKAPSTNVIDEILNAKSTTKAGTSPSSTPPVQSNPRPGIRRFAPVSNVMSIQLAKAKIDEIKNRIAPQKTLATTVAKGGKRSAHVPDMSLNNIPDVLHADHSKLPVNVRTRYLCLLADECLKLYVATDDAYNRALNEEFKCYERCKALPTYRNSAMLAVNRLRKEVQEREAAGLGPLQLGETHGKSSDSYLEGRKFYDLVKNFMLTEEELVQHGFPREGPTPGKAVISSEYKNQTTSEHLEANQRLCCRCHKIYNINREGFPLFEEECCYHPLRKRTIRGERTYLCCKSTEDTGCVLSGTHVSEVSADRELEGFQSTFDSESDDDPRDYAVYALDCEMCYTTKGLELTRVTVVNSKLKTIYESLVKPFNPIIDYNTRFSGITAEHMEKTTTNILQIQATILHLCSSKTILIGHSLESDMKALKIIHNSVVDTSVMFPHKFGLPHKRALRMLASDYLKKIIQNDVGGHDSAEDALAAMELVLWKVKEDLKVKGIKAT